MKKISAVAMVFVVVAFALLLTMMAGLSGVSAQTGDYDVDNDGLIEITYLEQLNAIRWDLDGDGVADEGVSADGYRAAFPGAIARMGCPQSGCEGYELMRNLDFNNGTSYASGTVNTSWTSGVGWLPIGVGTSYHQLFKTLLEGNHHTIHNLFINRSGESDPGVAGLFGLSDGDIRNVGMVDIDITAGDSVGGLVGENVEGSITSSYATGNVTGNDDVGGLVGYGENITSSYSTVNVSGNQYVGGLVGASIDEGILSSYATGNVTGNKDVGGLVGYGLYITSSYATGNVTGNNEVGGLAGSGFYITSSYATGNVTGNSQVGGLVGSISTTIFVNFVREESIITSSYATGSVSGRMSVGGLVGENYSGNISASYTTGSVTGSSEGSHRIGGLVGRNMFGSIGHSYATGGVTGNNQIGGLVGENVEGSITSSYSIGSVSGNYDAGGLVGENHDVGSITNGYWNTETSGQSEGVGKSFVDGVEGKTTAELQAPTGYTGIYAPWHSDSDNWDFGTSSQYPALKVDFNGDGTATWQEFGNQHNRPEPIATPVPTHTPTPVAGQDVLNRLSALEGLVATLQNRFSTSEALVTTLRDRLSASESAVAALQNRVTVLEGGTPPPQPTATPTPTPTPRPGEPTPPAELSPRAQEIDAAVKTYLEDVDEPATDEEIVAACRHLRGSSWDFFGLPLATPDRDYNIAAAIFLNTSGAFEIQMYCDEKQGI